MNEKMTEREIYTVTSENAGARLDVFLASASEISRSRAQKLIEEGAAEVYSADGKKRTVTKKFVLSENDTVEFALPEPEFYEALPENIPIDIIYEDEDVIVLNKPSGMVVHPAPGNETGTLVNALLYHCGESLSGIGGVMRPGIVHRIDRQTSGLLAVAKNDMAHVSLSEQLQTHEMYREYKALLVGEPKPPEGTVNAPIGRHPVDRKRMAVITGGGRSREAITDYKVEKRLRSRENELFSLVTCRLHTGRTHQIRVHMAYISHPVAGDEAYGAGKTRFEKTNSKLFDGQALHAFRLSFRHPRTGENVSFEAPLPENFSMILNRLTEE